ncbi:MAG: CPCC family cysteine-rich protein [Oscillospiraceae bacterium]|nr:CPCC family cysteine-rich protein [Oscillospiraceae bacterium]
MVNNKICECCGNAVLSPSSEFEICPICGWEDDDIQNDNPDMSGGANDMSLNEAKAAYLTGRKIQ